MMISTDVAKLPNVLAEHPDYRKTKPLWKIVRDVLEGEDHIKTLCLESQGTSTGTYLPLPVTEPDTTKQTERYNSYVGRAVLYNATERTCNGVVGQVFSKPPVAEFPPDVEYLQKDPAGTGVTLEQHAKKVLRDVLSVGRCFLLADYPALDKPLTVKQAKERSYTPTVTMYPAEDVINWRTKMRGSRRILSMVMLREKYLQDDGYECEWQYRYKELRLVGDVYKARIWEYNEDRSTLGGTVWVTPKNSKGKTFDEIPGVFVGIFDNDESVDPPPLYSLASLNLAHFRNSADYEESCFMVGQPTPWFSGLNDDWVKNTMDGKVWLGSRGGIPLPSGGAAGLLQAQPNGLAKEAMDQKEIQMVALGARLIQGSGVVRTATEATQDKVTEVSTLASAARNTSEAYKKVFEYCLMFTGSTSEIKFELSTDFDMGRMTSQEILAIVATWQSKLLTTEEARDILRRAGFATETIEEALKGGVLPKPEGEKPETAAKPADNRSKQA
jgi:hypothetical protein